MHRASENTGKTYYDLIVGRLTRLQTGEVLYVDFLIPSIYLVVIKQAWFSRHDVFDDIIVNIK